MTKAVQMTFRVEPELRASFAEAVDSAQRSAAQVLRELMQSYVNHTKEKSSVEVAPAQPKIDPQERRKRQDAVDFARASIGLEGFATSPEDEAIAQRFINGEIGYKEFMQVPRGPESER